MPNPWTLLLPLALLAAGGVLIVRRWEVRLILAAVALGLHVVAGKVPDFFATLFKEMANPKTILPICSAMGFAYVLKLTECDRHLVEMLIGPLRRVRLLLVPGGIAAAFVVNWAIQSQTGTAAVVGPILIPLLLAARVRPVTAGAVLLLGSSMGGELCNPGSVEIITLANLREVSLPAVEVVSKLLPLNLLACGVAAVVAWGMAVWSDDLLRRRHSDVAPADAAATTVTGFAPPSPASASPAPETAPRPVQAFDQALKYATAATAGGTLSDDAPGRGPFRLNLFKAVVPLLPIVLLVAQYVLSRPAFAQTWVGRQAAYPQAMAGIVNAGYAHKPPAGSKEAKPATVPATGPTTGPPTPAASPAALPTLMDPTTAATGTALLVGTFVAALTSPRRARRAAVAFFDGAGFAYTHVVSLIIVAAAVSEGIIKNRLIDWAVAALQRHAGGMAVLSVLLPWGLATVTGTGIGTGVACIRAIAPLAPALGLDPVRVGALIAISAQFGRTVSPWAPVVLMCATLSRTGPVQLVKRALPPLLAAGGVLIVAALLLGR